MLVFIIIGVIALLAFTGYKALTCSRDSEQITCYIWRVTHVLTALAALWNVRKKFQSKKKTSSKLMSMVKGAVTSKNASSKLTPIAAPIK